MAAQTCLRDMGDEHCVLHPGEKLVFECNQCNGELACMKCVTSVHQGHAMVDIKGKVEENIVKINSFINLTKEQTLPELKMAIKHTIGSLQENEQKYQNEIREVKKQEKHLKELVEVYTATKVSRLEFLLKETRDMLERRRTYLDKVQHDLMKDIYGYEQTVKSGSDVYIHDTQTQILRRLDVDIPSTLPIMTTHTFTPCKNPKEYIEKAFGEFREVKSGSKTAQVLPKYRFLDHPITLQELLTSYSVARNGISCTPDNITWIVDVKGKLHCIDHTGKEQKIQQPDVNLRAISTHPITGELFCTTTSPSDKSIRRVNTGRGTTSVMFHTDLEPFTIGCTTDNHIVVCVSGGTTSIRKYSFSGEVIGTYSTYNYSKSSWTLAISVCSRTNKIALMDASRRVTVLDNSLVELYQYKGHGGQMFYTAAFNDKYLLVGDCASNNILVLDKGTLVRTIHKKEMSQVIALSAKQARVLFVGCWDPDKILQIKFIE